ncbi:hypothetical protein D9M68_705520 [compost metagenome]
MSFCRVQTTLAACLATVRLLRSPPPAGGFVFSGCLNSRISRTGRLAETDPTPCMDHEENVIGCSSIKSSDSSKGRFVDGFGDGQMDSNQYRHRHNCRIARSASASYHAARKRSCEVAVAFRDRRVVTTFRRLNTSDSVDDLSTQSTSKKYIGGVAEATARFGHSRAAGM